MATTEVTEHIDRPIEEVFGYLADPSRHPIWQRDLASDGIVDGDGGVGSRGRETRRLMGRTVVTDYEVTEHVVPNRWAFRALRGPVPMSGVLSCVQVGSGTRVTAALTFTGWSGEVMARFGQRQFRDHLQVLKELMEGGRDNVGAGSEQ